MTEVDEGPRLQNYARYAVSEVHQHHRSDTFDKDHDINDKTRMLTNSGSKSKLKIEDLDTALPHPSLLP